MKRKIALLCVSVLMFTGIFCFSAQADAFSDGFAKQVFEGKDGWLFYSGEDTIPDYQGTDLYTLSQLEELCMRLEAFRDTLALQDCEFVIMIVPNKEQLYSQYMPDTYGPLTPYTRAQQVTDYLRSYGLRVVYPIEELKEASLAYPEYDIYYRRDTHWSELGAYIGAKALMGELGIDMPPVEELVIEPYAHDSADLGKAIGRSLKDTGYNITGYIYETMDTFDTLTDYMVRTSRTGVDERKVLLSGDSFLDLLFRYVCQEFDDVTVNFDRTLDTAYQLESIHPDVYIFEIVERYIDDMNTGVGLTAPASWTAEAMELVKQREEETYDLSY